MQTETSEQLHPITEATRRILMPYTLPELKRIATAAGVSWRSLYAIQTGDMREMRLTKQLKLAHAVGIRFSFKLPRRGRSERAAARKPSETRATQ